jgi:hypothetical protein
MRVTADYVRRQLDWWDRNCDDYYRDPDLAYDEYALSRAAEEHEAAARRDAAD